MKIIMHSPSSQEKETLVKTPSILLVFAEGLQLHILVIVASFGQQLVVRTRLAHPSFLDEVTIENERVSHAPP